MRRQPNKQNRLKEEYFSEVIRLYKYEGLSGPQICKIIPLHNSTVYRWLDLYEGKKKGKYVSKESTSNKQQRVTGLQAPELPVAETASPLKAVTSGEDGVDNGTVHKEKAISLKIAEQAEEIRQLKALLLEANLKADLYKEIITVTEQKFGIRAIKKAGTKQ